MAEQVEEVDAREALGERMIVNPITLPAGRSHRRAASS